MSKRINIVLPEKTLAILAHVTSRGNRSAFISRAVTHYVESQGKDVLRKRLKEEAIANAARDVEMAAAWFPLEQEAAARSSKGAKRQPKGGRQRSHDLSSPRRRLPRLL